MTTVRELIEKLQTLDPETEVKVSVVEDSNGPMWGGCGCRVYTWGNLDLEKYSDTFDVYKNVLYLGEV